jgi:Flp pilus assembly protein TadD
LSLALSANDQAHEALRHIEIGMRLNPRPTGYFHMVKGLALALVHRTDEAMQTYREGLAAWPVYRWNMIYLAHCCLRNGRAAEAHQLLDQFRAVEPTRELLFRNPFTDPRLRRRHAEAMQRLGFTEVP